MHSLSLESPSEVGRYNIIRKLLSDAIISPEVSLQALAMHTAAFSAVDLESCILQAKLSAIERATRNELVFRNFGEGVLVNI